MAILLYSKTVYFSHGTVGWMCCSALELNATFKRTTSVCVPRSWNLRDCTTSLTSMSVATINCTIVCIKYECSSNSLDSLFPFHPRKGTGSLSCLELSRCYSYLLLVVVRHQNICCKYGYGNGMQLEHTLYHKLPQCVRLQ